MSPVTWIISTNLFVVHIHLIFMILPTTEQTSMQMGKRLNSRIFDTLQPYGPKMCENKCQDIRRCKSINFNRETLQCELSSAVASMYPSLFNDEEEYMYMEMDYIPGSNILCQPGSRNVELSNGFHICVYTECSAPPPMIQQATLPHVIGDTVGTNLTYTCNTGYYPSGEKTTLCTSAGQWTPVSLVCQQQSNSVTNCLHSNNCWVQFNFLYDIWWSECTGAQFVRATNYPVGKYLGVVLCNNNEHRYKLFLSDGLNMTFLNIATKDTLPENHCVLVGGDTQNGIAGGPFFTTPAGLGFFRPAQGAPFEVGPIGFFIYQRVSFTYYECGVDIPGQSLVVQM